MDVVIIGGGPAGLCFARSLKDSGLDVCIVEKQPESELANVPEDGREIAHTHHSVHLLQALGIWSRLPPEEISPIREAKVLDGSDPYTLHFDYRDMSTLSHGLPENLRSALGYLVPNHLIRRAAYEEVREQARLQLLAGRGVMAVYSDDQKAVVTLEDGEEIHGQLLISADSRYSTTRRMMGISAAMRDFGRSAIVCRVAHELDHDHVAYECFRYGITVALLPMNNKVSSVVITLPSSELQAMLDMSVDSFGREVETLLSSRFGQMRLDGERFSYPLVGVYADRFVGTRYALIGDAAVGMHPVTAHGFNLGLKSQESLAKHIIQAHAKGQNIASTEVLQAYERDHRRVSKPLYLGTNAVVQLYTSDSPLSRLARKGVLRFGNRFTPLKHQIMNQLTEVVRSV